MWQVFLKENTEDPLVEVLETHLRYPSYVFLLLTPLKSTCMIYCESSHLKSTENLLIIQNNKSYQMEIMNFTENANKLTIFVSMDETSGADFKGI